MVTTKPNLNYVPALCGDLFFYDEETQLLIRTRLSHLSRFDSTYCPCKQKACEEDLWDDKTYEHTMH